ncbi:hypothetical protein LCGC14_2059890 [marine sediment metagenome]|uniref:Thymidylate synthase (FAD) n=1 Tax=marine sediment metagenome TaxID=412755 RepID=A0A0F9ELL5_9ZZZZ
MKIIKPSVKLVYITPNAEQLIEKAGRTCYKSESKITIKSSENFIKMIVKRGHESVLEHGVASLRFICDRGVTHEMVRHRIASYSQESTRYCNYSSKDIEFIEPCFWEAKEAKTRSGNGCYLFINIDDSYYNTWLQTMEVCESAYKLLIKQGATPQEARSVLPNSLKTEIVMTTNFRSWRNFFGLRCAKDAHPQMQEVANMALDILRKECPTVFGDIKGK